MAIAGAVVVVGQPEDVAVVQARLSDIPEVEVRGVGPKGIAVVIETENSRQMQKLSERINGWDEVIDFQVALVNWEDEEEAEDA